MGDESPMSRILTLSHSGPFGAGERKKSVKSHSVPSGGIGRLTLNFLLVVLICVLGVFYIFEVNNLATKGYEIRGLEKKIQELKENNEKLRIREAELKSMYNIEQSSKNFNMTAPKDVSYLSLPGDVAMK